MLNKSKLLFWSPRILAIIYILFLAIFALDVFIPGQSWDYYLIAFLMHLTPNFVLLILLLVAWKYEKIGAILFGLAFLILFLMFWDRSFVWLQFLLFSPLLLISWLLLMHSNLRR